MAEKYLVVDGQNFPFNLKELKKQDCDLKDYTVKPIYFLELFHYGLFGFYPAVIKLTKRILVSTDRDLVINIWKTLPPRNSELKERLFYIHKNGKVGYPAKPINPDESLAMGYILLTEVEFNELNKDIILRETVFDWAPGLLGDNISQKEFLEIINDATKKVLI